MLRILYCNHENKYFSVQLELFLFLFVYVLIVFLDLFLRIVNSVVFWVLGLKTQFKFFFLKAPLFVFYRHLFLYEQTIYVKVLHKTLKGQFKTMTAL